MQSPSESHKAAMTCFLSPEPDTSLHCKTIMMKKIRWVFTLCLL